jgi:carboxylesterase type B
LSEIKENQKIAVEIKETANTETHSSILTDEQKAKLSKTEKVKEVLKVRNLTDFIKTKREAQIVKADRAIERQQRSYIVYANDDNKTANVYYSTTYFNQDSQKEEQLDIHTTRKLISNYIKHLKKFDKFMTKDVQQKFATKGSNYCDFLRTAIYEHSITCTKEQLEKDFDACVLRAKSVNKELIRVNLTEDSRRAIYQYIKVV